MKKILVIGICFLSVVSIVSIGAMIGSQKPDKAATTSKAATVKETVKPIIKPVAAKVEPVAKEEKPVAILPLEDDTLKADIKKAEVKLQNAISQQEREMEIYASKNGKVFVKGYMANGVYVKGYFRALPKK